MSRPRSADRPAAIARWLVVGLLAAAAACAVAGWRGSRSPDDAELVVAARRGYAGLWGELDALAASAAQRLAARPAAAVGEAAFAELAAARADAASDRSLFLFDRFGSLAAWSGDGLAHALGAPPAAGRSALASFGAVSLVAVAPLPPALGGTVVAGASFRSGRAPFPLPRGMDRRVTWTAAASPPVTPPPGGLVVTLPQSPALVLRRDGAPSPPAEQPAVRWALAALGAAAAVWGWMRRRGGALPPVAGGAAALAAWALAVGAGAAIATAVAAAFALAAGGWLAPAAAGGGRREPLLGAAAATGALAGGALVQRAAGPLDLAAAFVGGDPRAVALRFAVALVAFAPLALAARGGAGRRRGAAAAGGLVALSVAALQLDRSGLAAGLLLAAGALLGEWLGGLARRARAAQLAVGWLVAAALTGVAVEVTHRVAVRPVVAHELLPALAPPSRQELEAVRGRVLDFFSAVDLAELTAGDPATLLREDLGYLVWREAPLHHERALSAVRVEPLDGEASEFALGLTLAAGQLAEGAAVGGGRPVVWDYALVADEAVLALRGAPWARVRFWLLPQPGFGFAETAREGLSRRLLRGGPGMPRTVEERLRPARYALYGTDGAALLSPWPSAPDLPADLRDGGARVLRTPDGPAWAYAAAEADGTRVLFLPQLGPAAAFERTGTATAGLLLLGGLLAAAAVLLGSGDAAYRAALTRPLRSYPIRLVVVFSLLLVVPAVAVNSLLLAAVSRRLEADQRAAGEAALEAAERVLGDYAAAQAPGVSIDTVLDDDLLDWLSTVVRYEVNLYFGGTVYATSKRELYTAGLLPARVPGEIYARLGLLGQQHASRLARAGTLTYRELYAPLLVPGVTSPRTGLFLSVPLLTQEEEVGAELAAIRRKVLVATTGLVLLLAGLGARLARGFTAPLTDLVAGTRRIAAGASSLELPPPPFVELSTLAAAIDSMAGRVAAGRQQLLREKRVVEQMVESITAAVVSVDSAHRVLLQNRAAAELLGTAVGEGLEARLTARPALAGVVAFVRAAADRLRHDTVRLAPAGDEEARDWAVAWVPIAGEGEPAALFVVEDITDVLRGQRLQAWAEMARIIAHEIKNPLTPIRLSAEHMREVRERDPKHFDAVFERCTRNILEHVDELQAIASEFSTYSRIPRIELADGDLAAFVEGVVDGYRVAPPRGVSVTCRTPAVPLRARFDARLLARALRNLLENALRATAAGGAVAVTLEAADGAAEIHVEDDGPGVPADDLGRIFEPYFSTHDAGTGLGLPIARRIAEEHGGRVAARNRETGGLRVTIRLPLAPDQEPGGC